MVVTMLLGISGRTFAWDGERQGFLLGLGLGLGVGVQLFFFTGTKRGVVIVQQHAQIGCIVGMHCAVRMLIGAKFVLHNLHERAQLARVQMGVRNHDGCAG